MKEMKIKITKMSRDASGVLVNWSDGSGVENQVLISSASDATLVKPGRLREIVIKAIKISVAKQARDSALDAMVKDLVGEVIEIGVDEALPPSSDC